MPRKRYSAEEIVNKLRQAEVLLSQGQNVSQASKQLGITDQIRGTDADELEEWVYHGAGQDGLGGSSYIDDVVKRWRDVDENGSLEERSYFCPSCSIIHPFSNSLGRQQFHIPATR